MTIKNQHRKKPDLYPPAQPFSKGSYAAPDCACLYYERHGNPDGENVVYLHGGPGAGCSFKEYRWFDPAHYNILIFDQRGAGQSTPYAETKNNSIEALVNDLENLRCFFNIEKWSICGGSWGSALAMFYTARYPNHVKRLLLRGIFFADQKGCEHIIQGTGAPDLKHNVHYKNYLDFIDNPRDKNQIKPRYYQLINSDKNTEASRLFALFNTSIAYYNYPEERLQDIQNCKDDQLALKNIWFHFSTYEFKTSNRQQLLKATSETSIPIDIIHGKQDYICPVQNAVDLHKACQNSSLQIFDRCGHAQTEVSLLSAFISITDKWRNFNLGL